MDADPVLDVAKVIVELIEPLPGVKLEGENEHWLNAGNPEQLKNTLPLKGPNLGPTVIVYVPELPRATGPVDAEAEIVKSVTVT